MQVYDPKNEPFFLHGGAQTSSLDQVFAVAADDSMITSAILCTAAGSIYTVTSHEDHLMMSIVFKNEAIRELRARVGNPKLDDCVLIANAAYTISLLIWVEVGTIERPSVCMLMSYSVWLEI